RPCTGPARARLRAGTRRARQRSEARGEASVLTGSSRVASLSQAAAKLASFTAARRLQLPACEGSDLFDAGEESTWHDAPADADTARARAATWRVPCAGASAARFEAGSAAREAERRAASI